MIHEVIVARLKDATSRCLPASDMKVDEDKAGVHLGEVSELDQGCPARCGLTWRGIYLLYCDLPGHYMAGQVCVGLDFPPTADLFLLARV
jgi:uncharacterized cupredoxin-like copper-binding protein